MTIAANALSKGAGDRQPNVCMGLYGKQRCGVRDDHASPGRRHVLGRPPRTTSVIHRPKIPLDAAAVPAMHSVKQQLGTGP